MSVASVADSASSTELLVGSSALNGASVFNDSTEILYLLQGNGTAVVASNWSVKLGPGDYWESPHPNYVRGGLTGIWANNASGFARVTTW